MRTYQWIRQLLQGPGSATTVKRPTLSTTDKPQKKATSSGQSEPAFKPRKVKKAELKYRDRASERREGVANDYAEVEAILQDFEQRAAREGKDAIEEQRKYLGGDSQHTILVKGLDMSLLEQNRARVAASDDDDDILEQAYMEATTTVTTEPKKRTREDIIRELKSKQGNSAATHEPATTSNAKSPEEERLALEAAKQSGKFKPIGFKPIGQKEVKVKKRKVKSEKDGVKKKRKVEKPLQDKDKDPNAGAEAPPALSTKPVEEQPSRAEPEPEPVNEDFDIFAGAGEYQGITDADESSSEHGDGDQPRGSPMGEPTNRTKGGWFDDAESEPSPPPTTRTSVPKSPPQETVIEEEGGRLKALESSALPSIRDFLAMQDAAEKEEKRKARKEKKKKKKGNGDGDDD
ncbi:hypothetical protein ID866_7257 [Astraeus odoratus]|nr:hypothetical protein ID866_7257 [Astraeus odoratus]